MNPLQKMFKDFTKNVLPDLTAKIEGELAKSPAFVKFVTMHDLVWFNHKNNSGNALIIDSEEEWNRLQLTAIQPISNTNLFVSKEIARLFISKDKDLSHKNIYIRPRKCISISNVPDLKETLYLIDVDDSKYKIVSNVSDSINASKPIDDLRKSAMDKLTPEELHSLLQYEKCIL